MDAFKYYEQNHQQNSHTWRLLLVWRSIQQLWIRSAFVRCVFFFCYISVDAYAYILSVCGLVLVRPQFERKLYFHSDTFIIGAVFVYKIFVVNLKCKVDVRSVELWIPAFCWKYFTTFETGRKKEERQTWTTWTTTSNRKNDKTNPVEKLLILTNSPKQQHQTARYFRIWYVRTRLYLAMCNELNENIYMTVVLQINKHETNEWMLSTLLSLAFDVPDRDGSSNSSSNSNGMLEYTFATLKVMPYQRHAAIR